MSLLRRIFFYIFDCSHPFCPHKHVSMINSQYLLPKNTNTNRNQMVLVFKYPEDSTESKSEIRINQ